MIIRILDRLTLGVRLMTLSLMGVMAMTIAAHAQEAEEGLSFASYDAILGAAAALFVALVGRFIPDDATGLLGILRKVAKILTLSGKDRQTKNDSIV